MFNLLLSHAGTVITKIVALTVRTFIMLRHDLKWAKVINSRQFAGLIFYFDGYLAVWQHNFIQTVKSQ